MSTSRGWLNVHGNPLQMPARVRLPDKAGYGVVRQRPYSSLDLHVVLVHVITSPIPQAPCHSHTSPLSDDCCASEADEQEDMASDEGCGWSWMLSGWICVIEMAHARNTKHCKQHIFPYRCKSIQLHGTSLFILDLLNYCEGGPVLNYVVPSHF